MRDHFNLLVNHGSIPLGTPVQFRDTEDTFASTTGTIARGDRIGIEINGEVISNLREALKLGIGSYQLYWLEKIMVTDESGENRSIQEYWENFVSEFEKNLPKITKEERTYCKAIYLKHESIIRLINRVASDQ